jgi:hypothetical protein
VPLRFPRPALVPAAVGLAAASVLLGSSPTLADQVRNQEWWLRALHVTQAWHTTQGSGVTVAVLDTGVDAAQPDLAGSVLPGPDFTGSGEKAGSPFVAAHGTAVASLIGGHGHGPGARGSGIIGVAPEARILPVRVTLDAGDPLLASGPAAARLPGAIAAGIRYAARQGAKVIDLPLDPAQTAGRQGGGTDSGSAAERSAIAYALSQGAVVVGPAGDGGSSGNAVSYPAAYPGVISVGAFNQAITKSAFSARQDYVTLTAPGEGVIAARPAGYATMNSTSAASAVVAGIAALIRSQYPQLAPGGVTKALENGTVFRPNGKTGVGSGFGTADAAKALSAAATLAGSGARRSGTGAAERAQPAPPPVPPIRQSTASRLTKDGLISGAVLILLLIPIGVLAVVRRRRARLAATAADWRRPMRSGDNSASHGQPHLGYLAAPPTRAPQAPGPRAASPRRGAAARNGAAGSQRDAPGRVAGVSSGAAPGGAAGHADSGVFAMAALGPAKAGRRDAPPGWDDPQGPAGYGVPAGFGGSAALGGRPAGPGGPGGPGANGGAALPGQDDGRGGAGAGPGRGAAGPLGGSGAATGAGPHGGRNDLDLAGLDPGGSGGPGGFSGSSSFTGLSPRAPAPASGRPSAAGQVPPGQVAPGQMPPGQVPPGPALTPVSRPPGGRQPRISGTPPWEPAAKPDSELPWATVPPPQPVNGPAEPLPRRPVAHSSIWDTAGHREGPGSGGTGTGTDRPGAGEHGADGPGADEHGADGAGPGDADSQIYLWNPAATTDTFPALPKHGRPRTED